MSTLLETISDYEAKRKELIKRVQNGLADAAKELFDKYPAMESFAWNQGLYYNDSDYDYRCNNDSDSLIINGIMGYNSDADQTKQYHEVSEFLTKINDDILREVFGENAKIVVSREGVCIEEQDDY